jgi:hypothetical protein
MAESVRLATNAVAITISRTDARISRINISNEYKAAE